ncbi:putative zinc metalloprotease [subsurface metagenome]
MILTILAFLGILAVVIIAHELGHFTTAKAFGVKVEEFGVGFPPRLIGIRRGETLYSLNAIPLGGFTKMAGEEDPQVSRSLASKRTGVRILVLSAGSLMNALLPILLFSIAFMIPHDMVTEPTVVKAVSPGSPAESAGIEPGDTLIGINGHTVNNFSQFQRYVLLNLGKETTILVEHSDAATEEFQLIPRWEPPEGEGSIGVERDVDFALANRTVVSQSYPFWEAIPMGAGECVETFVLFKNEIIRIFIGASSFQVTGPVGIAQMTGEVARSGISPLLEFAGFISINLAIINLFPIPALDGGRIIFVLVEWIRRGKRVSPRTEGLVHAIGFIMLMAAILALTYQDIARIIAGKSLLP